MIFGPANRVGNAVAGMQIPSCSRSGPLQAPSALPYEASPPSAMFRRVADGDATPTTYVAEILMATILSAAHSEL